MRVNNIISAVFYYGGAVIGGVAEYSQGSELDFSFFGVFKLGMVAFFSACAGGLGREVFNYLLAKAKEKLRNYLKNR